MLSIHNSPKQLKISKLNSSNLLSAYYLLGIGWALGSFSAVQRNINGATERSFPPKWQEEVCLGLREPVSPLLLPSRAGMEFLGTDAVSLLTVAVMEESREVSKQLWNLLHNPHSDVSPRSSGSRGQCMKSSLKFS